MNKEQLDFNEDDATEFLNTIKTEFEELEWLKSDKIYKLNKEGKFDVINYKLETPVRAIFSQLEDQNYTREEWEDTIKDFVEPVRNCNRNFYDEDIIAAAKAFMVGPVSVQQKKVIEAESRTFDSLEELKENILTEAKEKDMVLYWTYSYEKLQLYKGTFKLIEDAPEVIQYVWRGVFLDKQ
jgi:hypothetical protein